MSFIRVCPSCLGVNGMEAAVCGCGHKFSSLSDNGSSHTCEVVRAQTVENHYEEYFVLRLKQAQARLRALVAEHGTGGWSPYVRREVDTAIAGVEQAKRELSEQRSRTETAKQAVDVASTRVAIRKLGALANKEW